jgi:hypothetical protein
VCCLQSYIKSGRRLGFAGPGGVLIVLWCGVVVLWCAVVCCSRYGDRRLLLPARSDVQVPELLYQVLVLWLPRCACGQPCLVICQCAVQYMMCCCFLSRASVISDHLHDFWSVG